MFTRTLAAWSLVALIPSMTLATECDDPLKAIDRSPAWQREKAKTLEALKAAFDTPDANFERRQIYVLIKAGHLRAFKLAIEQSNQTEHPQKHLYLSRMTQHQKWRDRGQMYKIEGAYAHLYLLLGGFHAQHLHWYGFKIPPTSIQKK